MTATDNLWPEFSLDEVIRSPKTILKEQAEFLAKGTKNILTAKIKTIPYNNGDIEHEFYVIAPNLNGYSYMLFSVSHDGVSPYPCEVFEGESLPRDTSQATSEENLKKILAKIFNNSNTKNVIKSLISQSIENKHS